MANNSLDSFWDDNKTSVTNFDWLDIDPSEYDNVPFHDLPSYMAIPKLEEAWCHTKDTQNFNLVPNMDMNLNVQGPQDSKKDNSSEIKSLVDYVKKQMMSGKTGKDLVELVSKKATPAIIKEAYPELQKLAKEQGLLGNVYVDPTVFERCTVGAEYTGRMAKTAKFVLSMNRCSNCMHNRCQRCEVYKKKIASEVIYDQDTLNFYSKHFSNISGRNVTISSRNELQNKFNYKPEVIERVAANKPNLDEQEEKTLDQKKKEYNKNVEELKKSLSDLTEVKVGNEISALLIKGYDSKVIASHIKNKYSAKEYTSVKNVISYILAKQGSLGRIFVEADFLPVDDSHDEKNITELYEAVKNIVSDGLKTGGKFLLKSFFSGTFRDINLDLKNIFKNVTIYKPVASRSKSSEIYLVCMDKK